MVISKASVLPSTVMRTYSGKTALGDMSHISPIFILSEHLSLPSKSTPIPSAQSLPCSPISPLSGYPNTEPLPHISGKKSIMSSPFKKHNCRIFSSCVKILYTVVHLLYVIHNLYKVRLLHLFKNDRHIRLELLYIAE